MTTYVKIHSYKAVGPKYIYGYVDGYFVENDTHFAVIVTKKNKFETRSLQNVYIVSEKEYINEGEVEAKIKHPPV
jgi:hypothetical protein